VAVVGAIVVLVAVPVTLAGGASAAAPKTRALFAAVTGGSAHTCALTTKGAVKCWGINVFGEAGNGGQASSYRTPVDVVGLSRGVKAISAAGAAGDHTCALTGAGGVRCWGRNINDQLLVDAFLKRTPVALRGMSSGIRGVAAGYEHTCVLTTKREVRCWGTNSSGQLGNGRQTAAISPPVSVVGLGSGVEAIAVGGYPNGSTCAVTAGGGAKCWGADHHGQIGNGALKDWVASPADVVGLGSGVSAISIGYLHACALTSVGGVKCWGSNTVGQLGNGPSPTPNAPPSTTPVEVSGLARGVRQIAAGGNFTCALLGSGGVKCWGSNDHGQLGTGSTARESRVPVDVVGLRGKVKAIGVGLTHSCAVTTAGALQCWGWNELGQIGNGSSAKDVLAPAEVVAYDPTAAATKPDVSAKPATPSRALRAFVDQVAGVLAKSSAARKQLATALAAGFSCRISTAAAAARLGAVINARGGQLAALAQLRGRGPQASQALQLLRAALKHSVDADIHYRNGFAALGPRTCPLPPNRNFAQARTYDRRASEAKQRFVDAFNPLARSVGRHTWTARQI
jgi:alpha-tubulin suppressor-like RCC1 family protein